MVSPHVSGVYPLSCLSPHKYIGVPQTVWPLGVLIGIYSHPHAAHAHLTVRVKAWCSFELVSGGSGKFGDLLQPESFFIFGF